MGAVSGFNALFGFGMNAVQSYQEAKEQNKQLELAAQELEAQAGEKRLAAQLALQQGEADMAEQGVGAAVERGALRVSYAASGVKVDTGSAVAAQADHAAWSEYDRQKIQYQAESKAWGLNLEADQLAAKSAGTRAGKVNPLGSAVSSLVSGSGAVTGDGSSGSTALLGDF
ncbi:MAG: hypothetical protein LIP23_09210 [Planctomycetes bacterium]|nr:hypothetical protein [Planctomycetota bacterium]